MGQPNETQRISFLHLLSSAAPHPNTQILIPHCLAAAAEYIYHTYMKAPFATKDLEIGGEWQQCSAASGLHLIKIALDEILCACVLYMETRDTSCRFFLFIFFIVLTFPK